MKIFLLLALLSVNVFGTTSSYFPAGGESELNRAGGPLAKYRVGTNLFQSNTAIATYDYTKDGGATGTKTFPLYLPNKAIVREVFFDVVQAPVSSGGSGTIAFTLNSAADLKTALATSSWSGRVAGIPVGTAATFIKLTARRQLTMTVATQPLTAGKIKVYIDYVTGE